MQTTQAPDVTDDALIASCLAAEGPSQAFDALYRRHAESVLAFLYGMHRRDAHAARDALQETFIRFFHALPAFKRGRPVRPFLLRIARNVSLDAWKRAEVKHTVSVDPERLAALRADPDAPDPAEQAARREAFRLARRAVDALPPGELAVFLLKHDQGLTYAEVAEALSCSVRTAKYRMKSALERLGREVERMGMTR